MLARLRASMLCVQRNLLVLTLTLLLYSSEVDDLLVERTFPYCYIQQRIFSHAMCLAVLSLVL
jgi:hypothetical protein